MRDNEKHEPVIFTKQPPIDLPKNETKKDVPTKDRPPQEKKGKDK